MQSLLKYLAGLSPNTQSVTPETPEKTLELNGGMGPIEGRPPGALWAHQGFARFPPAVAIEVAQEGAKINSTYNPGCGALQNSGIGAGQSCRPCFHPDLGLSDQQVSDVIVYLGR